MPLVPGSAGVAAPVGSPGPGASPAATNPASTTPAPRASGPKFGIWPWVGLGAGVVALGGSLGFELARRSAENDAEHDDTQIGYKEKFDREHSRQTTARVLGAVGGALVVTGGVLLVIQLTSHEPADGPSRVGLSCLPTGCAVDLGGRF